MDAIIVGAGIAGLTAAYHLKQKGLKVCLLEKSNRWGGCLHSVRFNGCLLEKGPNSFLGSQETVQGHIAALGLEGEVIEANAAAKKRFILANGKLIPFPKGPVEFLKTPLLTLGGKGRLLLEPLIRKKTVEEESVAQFVARRLGRQALRLVEPMINGIYAGDAENLSLQAIAPGIAQWEKEYGSLFKALRKARLLSKGQTLYSFKRGMQTLADALHERVKGDCHLNCLPLQITKPKGGWKVNDLEAPLLILAVPAEEAAALLKNIDHALSGLLDLIPYAPLAVIHLIVERSQIDHPLDGFGFLSGAGENNFLTGCLWSSSIFEGRCEASKVLLTCFAGGAKDGGVIHLSEEEISARTLASLQNVFKARLQPESVSVTKLSRALPQYTLGHAERLRSIQRQVEALPGLCLVGNYLDGISVNDTMAGALRRINDAGHIEKCFGLCQLGAER
ncbi:MAG: protoporphyrinogen oxidase [Deltaproteobacteria bacterium]|nr:protoporphyrinogen oxidase [Deltaproteobacteria bacterium]